MINKTITHGIELIMFKTVDQFWSPQLMITPTDLIIIVMDELCA